MSKSSCSLVSLELMPILGAETDGIERKEPPSRFKIYLDGSSLNAAIFSLHLKEQGPSGILLLERGTFRNNGARLLVLPSNLISVILPL